jgi:hypothetical protein
MNEKAGHKVQIPLGTLSKGALQAQNEANTAQFVSSDHPSPKPQKETTKTVMKGIYFEPVVLNRLLELQKDGQNVSKLVNKVVKQHLGLNDE